ncbi:hypothetical protein T265_06917 [Opisthorchis viverrini]|uniref:Uncharacterized protein n=1 Tax=Opisthorchis viverrini TaxID=6198 RepID=A0A074ZET5_OPIVI|nr:hypothetical protein T265_06917 [Opisthorchis viverrini]KER25683.1 hypothetical protein T265_06917 [Opisthorchis viverrini]
METGAGEGPGSDRRAMGDTPVLLEGWRAYERTMVQRNSATLQGVAPWCNVTVQPSLQGVPIASIATRSSMAKRYKIGRRDLLLCGSNLHHPTLRNFGFSRRLPE